MPDKTQSESAMSGPSSSSQKIQLTPAQNNPCSLCRAFGVPPPCKGHGGSGGGGDGSSGSSDGENNNNKSENNYDKIAGPALSVESVSSSFYSTNNEVNNLTSAWREQLTSSLSIIHLDKGLLNIECDNVRGTLTFQIKSG